MRRKHKRSRSLYPTCEEIRKMILEEGVVPTPIYTKSRMRRSIVCSRSIWDREPKKRIKLRLK